MGKWDKDRSLRWQIELVVGHSRDLANRIKRRLSAAPPSRIRRIWDRLVREFVNPGPRRSMLASKTEVKRMSYGDSANWDGKVPEASYTEYMIEWRTKFKGSGLPLFCSFEVNTDYEIMKVAGELAGAWNGQNPSARRAIYNNANPNLACKVQFDGEVAKMWVRGYLKPAVGTPPPPESSVPFKEVAYGDKTQVLTNSAGDKLSVFRA